MARHNSTIDETDQTFVDPDVDVPTVDDETDTPAEGAASGEGKTKKDKEPARGDLPEGVVTPVGFAKILTEKELHTAKDGSHEVKPQMVYSYIRNASKNDPFPVETVKDSLGKDRQVVNIEAGLAWWTRKNERVAERSANAKAKADKKAAKAEATTEAEASGEPVVEAE